MGSAKTTPCGNLEPKGKFYGESTAKEDVATNASGAGCANMEARSMPQDHGLEHRGLECNNS